jgi:hypothetical protein
MSGLALAHIYRTLAPVATASETTPLAAPAA